MGRTANISSGKIEEYYFSKDTLFSENEKGGASQWLGEGAKAMDLEGRVRFEDVVNVAHGYSPEGMHLVGKSTGEQSHNKRAGTDFAATVSKSSSICATFDENLRADIAQVFVDVTKGVEQSGWVEARQTKGGVTERVEAKMVAMLSTHSTSRSTVDNAKSGSLCIDPNIHGHITFMNLAIRPDNSFSTLSNDKILDNQSLIQQRIYNEVAHAELKNGYALDFKSTKEGLIYGEIKGIDKETISLFSTMHNAISNASEMKADIAQRFPTLNHYQVDEMAHIQLKAAKIKDLTADQLKSSLVERQAVLGKSLTEMISNAKTNENLLDKSENKLSAQQITSLAIKDVNETESKFSLESVELNSLKLSMGQFTVAELQTARQEALRSGELLQHGNQFTTPAMVALENGIATRVVEQSAVFSPLMQQSDINKAITSFEEQKGFRLSDGQVGAVELVLKSEARMCLISGDAGSGKTTSFSLVRQALDDNPATAELTIVGLGNAGKASAQLQHDSGIKSQTIASFLQKQDAPNEFTDKNHRELWIVDEASMAGSKQISQLLDKAEQRSAQICIVGDSKQILSISAGAVFSELQRLNLVEITAITEVKRQRLNEAGTNEYAITSAKAMREHEPEKAFQILSDAGKITVIEDRDERLKFVAAQYVNHDNQRETACLVETNKDRVALNNIVRAEQKEAGQIGQRDYVYISEHPVNLKAGDTRFAGNYHNENVITLNEKMSIGGVTFKAGTKLSITDNNTEKHTISFAVNSDANDIKFNESDRTKLNELKMADTTLTIDVLKNGDRMTLSELVSVSVAEREQLMILKNDNSDAGLRDGIKNGVRPIIEKIDFETGIATLKMEDNTIIERNLNDLPSTNGQVISIDKSQGLTVDTAISMLDNANENKAGVALTRHRYETQIVTADAEKLLDNMSVAQMKTSTLDDYPERSSEPEKVPTLEEINTKLDVMIAQIEDQKTNTLFDDQAKNELTEKVEVNLEAGNILSTQTELETGKSEDILTEKTTEQTADIKPQETENLQQETITKPEPEEQRYEEQQQELRQEMELSL
jgi:conjugative relaxase-like TrwC/TraI family protein